MQNIKIYLITDSVGETAKKTISAVVAQFPTVDLSDIHLYPFTKDKESLIEILNDARKEKAIVAITLVDKSLVKVVEKFSKDYKLPFVDFMSPLIQIIEDISGEEATQESGSVHQLNQAYFDRVAAIEFAVKYDDGKDPKGFLNADIVLLGVSRTSKTPLSMYLANKGYKVANLPIIPEVEVAKELFTISPAKIIGLTSNPESLSNIRSFREQTLGLKTKSMYSNEKRILEELAYAEALFEQLGIATIDVSQRSIEESSMLIENIIQK
ncbi:pyruvate, water dikinase regulatory protein [Lactococcus garvieae]|jgi:regulator of PEP synthase PpsR (kinase-PPPase family)|uniref:pyruvate, water dikinase regulatory protein n=1 Tax=Lactococcus garvieae TaxID=1363 RepID=UPI0009C0549F|nr:pyruvate, water dikinase regulatory protein [Lactococcus garvieae]